MQNYAWSSLMVSLGSILSVATWRRSRAGQSGESNVSASGIALFCCAVRIAMISLRFDHRSSTKLDIHIVSNGFSVRSQVARLLRISSASLRNFVISPARARGVHRTRKKSQHAGVNFRPKVPCRPPAPACQVRNGGSVQPDSLASDTVPSKPPFLLVTRSSIDAAVRSDFARLPGRRCSGSSPPRLSARLPQIPRSRFGGPLRSSSPAFKPWKTGEPADDRSKFWCWRSLPAGGFVRKS